MKTVIEQRGNSIVITDRPEALKDIDSYLSLRRQDVIDRLHEHEAWRTQPYHEKSSDNDLDPWFWMVM